MDARAHQVVFHAAVFGFCTACVAYNAAARAEASLRAARGAEFVANELSMDCLTLEVARVTPGTTIALPDWSAFRRMTAAVFAAMPVAFAKRQELKRYAKHKRDPKRKPPGKTTCAVHKHVSTARVLAGRK